MKRQRWEYLVLETAFVSERANIKMMNEYGADGWDLVSVIPTRDANSLTMHFKRPLPAGY